MQDKLIGRNPVAEALKSGADIDKIYVKKEADGSLLPILRKARERKIPISEVDRRKLDELSCGENHQGIVATVPAASYASVDDILKLASDRGEAPFVIILDKITDPHNLGSVIRTAHCAGAHGVIISKHGGVGLNSAAYKSAAGAAAYTPVARVTNIARTIDELKEKGVWIVGADMGGEKMYNVDMKGALGIVIGNEGDGISRLIREKCDFIAEIPMWGKIDSLNASVAAAVLIYEAKRQQMQA